MSDCQSDLLYIMNPQCGWCKKADPVIEEMKEQGICINVVDVTDPEQAKVAKEIQEKHNVRCGTPLFINAKTGSSVCGFRGREILDKWANGEDIPAPPPRPQPTPNQPGGPAGMGTMDPLKNPMFIAEKQKMRFEIFKYVKEKMKDTDPSYQDIVREAERIYSFVRR